MHKLSALRFIGITLFFILVGHYLAVFLHEYSHSFMAWALGYKENPLALNYGGTGLLNLLLLAKIDENVDYSSIFAAGHPTDGAFIGFAGIVANVLLFIVSYFYLQNKKVRRAPFLFYFLFLFNLMNLGNLYDYVPIRIFASFGDMYHFAMGLNVSPWKVYIIFGYIVAFLIWQFFAKTMIAAFIHLDRNTTLQRAGLMTLCVCILFGFFGGFPYIYFVGQANVGDITYFLSLTSLIAVPGVLVALWPTRQWVKRRVHRMMLELSKKKR